VILLDTNQIMISNLFATKGQKFDSGLLTLNDIRHAVLKGILYYEGRFKNRFGDIVLCYDSGNYWRTKQFPHYKANRKKKQKSDCIDWHKIYDLFSTVREEIKDSFPYVTMHVETVEADDIISVLVEEYNNKSFVVRQDETLIVSADKDFQQLQRYEGVFQYSPNAKDFIKCDDPVGFLIEHIIRGDSSDGIPNVLSDDDALINSDKKQTIMSAKRFNAVMEEVKTRKIVSSDSKFRRNWFRNKNLIDLGCIPKDSKKMITKEYYKEISSRHMKKTNPTSMEYLISNRLGNLTEFLN